MPHHPDQIVELLTDLNWGFDDQGPNYSLRHAGAWSMSRVDPTPCYHHNLARVQAELAHCQRVCPLPIPLKIAVLPHEDVGRTNGTYYNLYSYDENYAGGQKGRFPAGIIKLSGKRIPLHPAMTRYLVAHEYGHGVQYCLERLMGIKEDSIEPLYQEQFRPETQTKYGPLNWHNNIGELFANDFRILVAQVETEFWPHEGHPRPEGNARLVDFWKNVAEAFKRVCA